MAKYVYFFGGDKAEGGESLRNLVGGKGAGLADMVNLGIPVPPGFTITTEVCTYFYDNDTAYPDGLKEEVAASLRKVEEIMGMKFGDPKNPLLLSIRSGARASMPGMMDTVLNLGLNETTVKGLSALTNNEWFAYDCYRRFVAMYGDVVLGLKPQTKEEHDPFEEIIDEKKKARGVTLDVEFTVEDLKDLVARFKDIIQSRLDVTFPEDPEEQLWGAIGAVFSSWNNDRAIAYRKLNGIPASWGTAVNVQSMVFGNIGMDSGTGVAFTRNPATGENVFYGEYLLNAQGEDVVAGIRTPLPINKMQKGNGSMPCLEEEMPERYAELLKIRQILEKNYRDMQDIEFTIQKGKLWMLQTRSGKRTAFAAFKAAVDMVKEGLITKEEALMRVDP
ncbi:MAG TPA: pyruvate, phosphate dikinase, partial [Syntrophorhabdus aromaticivorans]|nr:pyruvate, phosphate dikinase [Syntrophorhabdus aromaticivorans]